MAIGFLTADRIARSIGVFEDSPGRIDAACIFSLQQAELDGHVYLAEGRTQATHADTAAARRFRYGAGLGAPRPTRRIAADGERNLPALLSACRAENGSQPGGSGPRQKPFSRAHGWSPGFFLGEVMDIQLEPQQKQAVQSALSTGLTVGHGRARTGKTTLVRAITAALDKAGFRVGSGGPHRAGGTPACEATGHPRKPFTASGICAPNAAFSPQPPHTAGIRLDRGG
jgi:exodeoxyribonuclease V alpha subunit